MKLKDILNTMYFNDIYKEVSNRKLKKKILPLQELYATIRKEASILAVPMTAVIDKQNLDGVSIYRHNEGLQQFDSLTLNEVASIEIEDMEHAAKIIAGILSFYTLQGSVFNDYQRQKELDGYKQFSFSMPY